MENLSLVIKKLQRLKLVRNNGCWGVPNIPNTDGYIRLSINRKLFSIHRVSAWYYLDLDYDDDNLKALHKNECNNRACWNPDHLYVGNQRDNLSDAFDLGKQTIGNFQTIKTHCPKGHEYTKSNTYINRTGSRFCKECNNTRRRKFSGQRAAS